MKLQNPTAHIEKIMREFDFALIHKVMVITDWEWAFGDTDRIPTEEEIRANAKRILDAVVSSGRGLSTGGFEAGIDKDENGNPYLYLTFTLESQNSEYLP